MMNNSSPPFVELLLIDFFEISGAPTGWATTAFSCQVQHV